MPTFTYLLHFILFSVTLPSLWKSCGSSLLLFSPFFSRSATSALPRPMMTNQSTVSIFINLGLALRSQNCLLFCFVSPELDSRTEKNSQNGVVIKRVFYNHPSKLLPPHKGTLVGPKCQDTLGVNLEVVCMGLHESLVFSRGQIFIKIIHPKCSKFPFSWTWN